jgi:hypothetical protein
MLTCMLYSMVYQHGDDYPFASSYTVFVVKFPSAVCLHFVLYPEVMQGMNIMKYTNNQAHLFTENGSEVSFMIGLLQFLTAIYCEGINCWLLSFQTEVEVAIIHFIALHVIMEIPKFYFEALGENHIKSIFHHPATIEKRGINIKMADRSLFHKVARVVYRVLRVIYVSVIFYLIPFVVFFIQYMWA